MTRPKRRPPQPSKPHRGFTLMELMAVVAITAILAGLTALGLTRAVRSARTSGDRFTLISAVSMARSRAQGIGRDVYVLFVNIDQEKLHPDPLAPQVILYEDGDFALRNQLASGGDPMVIVDAQPANVRERFVSNQSTGLFFRPMTLSDPAKNIDVPPCNVANIPAYLGIRDGRLSQRDCAPTWCTFCSKYGSTCAGVIRFNPQGQARVINGPDGSGALIKLVERDDPLRSLCIAVSEPAGLTMTIPD